MAEVGGRKKIPSTFSKTSFPWFERKSRLMELSIFKQPQCLIFEDESGKFAIKDFVLNEIEVIDVPLSIVAVVGLYRTGKSYLMNQLARKSKGFSMGHKVHCHTKGIWVWCIIHPTEERRVLMLLDTEGLADPKKTNKESDQLLFCLTVLLSSTLIYNVKGVFDADAIEEISFISKMSQNIKSSKNVDEQENEKLISLVSPIFILCIRDFYLCMDGEDNEYLNDDQFLESCLSEFGDDNETVKCIRKYFPNRTCFTMSMPVHPKRLKTLDDLNEEELDDDFVTEMQSLREYVYMCGQKMFLTWKIDGLALAEIVTTYVEAIRNGLDLNIEEAHERAAKKHNEVVVSEITNWLQNRIKEIQLPITRKEKLQDQFLDIHSTMMQKYREKAYIFESENEYENTLIEHLKVEWKKLRSRNSNCIQDICNEKLGILHDEIIWEHMGYLKSNFYSQMKDFDEDELDDAFQRFKDSMNEKKIEMMRKEKIIKDIKQKERMDVLLEKRLQEKNKSLQSDEIAHIENEKRKLIDAMLAQSKANTEALQSALKEVNKRTCILS